MPLVNDNSLESQVMAHALAHYEEGGWDIVVECMSKAEITEVIKGATTRLGAIRKMSAHLAPRAAYAADICATAF